MLKDKGLIIGSIITVLLIVGGVFYFSRGTPSTSSGTPISKDILVPKDEAVTSGISDGNYLPASASAKITLVEFGDYECPACGIYHPFVKQLLTDFAGKINYAFRNFPLSQHSNAPISSQAAEAAALQGKYWQMHDKLYESQSEWSSSSDAKTIFEGYVANLGMDINKFKTDIDSKVVKDKIQGDMNDGSLVNLNATPTFYINGVKIDTLPGTYNDFKQLITDAISKN